MINFKISFMESALREPVNDETVTDKLFFMSFSHNVTTIYPSN